MIGHDRIRAMRRNGIRPTIIWLSDFPGAAPDPEDKAISVRVHGDMPEALDLRFLVGIPTVVIEGDCQIRLRRLSAAVQEATTSRVITNRFDGHVVVHTTDTEGVMTWRK